MSAAWSPRTRWRRIIAITVAAVLAMGLGQVASGVPGDQDGNQDPVTGSLRSTCEFPVAGTQQVIAGITATFPVSVPAGSAVAGTDVMARLTLPEPTVAALRTAGARSVEGIVVLELAVAALGKASTTQATLEVTAQPLPETGDLLVEAPGTMNPVPTDGPGDLVLALGAPQLAVTLRAEDGTPITSDPNAPNAILPCTPEPGQDTALATVAVTDPDEAGTTTPVPPRSGDPSGAPGGAVTNPGEPSGTQDGSAAAPAAARPIEEICGLEIPPDARQSKNGFYEIVVTTTVKKLGAQIVFGPPAYLGGKIWIWFRRNPDPPGQMVLCNGLVGDLSLPPTRGSFVIFRFVPTTALVTINPVGPAIGLVDTLNRLRFTGRAVTNMTLSGVEVNGTPLDVGPNCRTATPITIKLEAENKDFNIADGGVLESDFTIPEFAGCGVLEPLDTLFTNLVSGPGNHIRIDVDPIRDCKLFDPPPPVCTSSAGR